MTINENLARAFDWSLANYRGQVSPMAADLNTVIPFQIVIDTTTPVVEIPIAYSVSDEVLSRNDKIVIPLNVEGGWRSCGSVETAVKTLFNREPYSGTRLNKIKTNKDEVFYGVRGLLLDENFDVLMMVTRTGYDADTHTWKTKLHLLCRGYHLSRFVQDCRFQRS